MLELLEIFKKTIGRFCFRMVDFTDESGQSILPYVERQSANDTPEEEELRLLYRDKKIMALVMDAQFSEWD